MDGGAAAPARMNLKEFLTISDVRKLELIEVRPMQDNPSDKRQAPHEQSRQPNGIKQIMDNRENQVIRKNTPTTQTKLVEGAQQQLQRTTATLFKCLAVRALAPY